MATIETSVNINKPVEEVFEFITNLDNQKKLSTYITGVEVDGPVKVGTKYVIETTSMGNVIKTSNEVVAFEANKTFGVKSFGIAALHHIQVTFHIDFNETAVWHQLPRKPSIRRKWRYETS